jgi:hypothetical protein
LVSDNLYIFSLSSLVCKTLFLLSVTHRFILFLFILSFLTAWGLHFWFLWFILLNLTCQSLE